MIDDDAMDRIIANETARLEKVRARHARETDARNGRIQFISREELRKCRVVMNTFSDAKEVIMSGKAKVDKLYRLAKGDKREPLFVKIPPELKERLRNEAWKRDVTLAELVTDVLTQIFG